MIQIINNLEMPLATQYLEDSLASIKQKDYSFLEQKESQITANK